MKKICTVAMVAMVTVLTGGLAQAQVGQAQVGQAQVGQVQVDKPVIVKKDPALDALISPDAKLEKIAGDSLHRGRALGPKGEAARVRRHAGEPDLMDARRAGLDLHEKCGYQAPDIWRVGFMQTNGKKREDPLFEEFPMIGCNGLTLDRQGRLVIATWAGRSIDRIEHNGKRTVLADKFQGKPFGGTNDVIVKKDGTIYFTDGFGGLRLREKDPKREIFANGVYMLKNGAVSQVIDDIPNTNGIALSPTKDFMLTAAMISFVKRYDVQADGPCGTARC